MTELDVQVELPASKPYWLDLWDLTKPRMNVLVLIATVAGFYMAAHAAADWRKLPQTLLGTALCAAGASALNQLKERRCDGLMRRTRNRPLPAGRVSPLAALWLGLATSLAGGAILAVLVNPLTAALGLGTVLAYVLIYTPLKQVTSLNTVIGAIPGAIPPVMGWAAVTGSLSPAALALFGIVFIWQIPHFLAVAILHRDDYAAGGFKMLPLADKNLRETRRQMVLYAAALLPVSAMPVLLHMAGMVYFAAAMVLGLIFLVYAVGCLRGGSRAAARKLFLYSIVYLPLLLVFLMIDRMSWITPTLHPRCGSLPVSS